MVYAVLEKRSSCNEFCEARNSICVDAVDNTAIGTGCEFDMEEAVKCNQKHFFDIHCVCRKPIEEGCSTVSLCDEMCNWIQAAALFCVSFRRVPGNFRHPSSVLFGSVWPWESWTVADVECSADVVAGFKALGPTRILKPAPFLSNIA